MIGAAELLEAFAELVAERVVAKLSAGAANAMIDQVASPLGRRRHCAAVRRRVSAGSVGAAIVGRRHLLSREALDAELAALAKRPKKSAAEPDDLADLRRKYSLERAP
jgi:hypothetical protein